MSRPAAVPRRRSSALLAVLLMLGLGACTGDPRQLPAWELAGHPGLLYDIKLYYERHAIEEDGRCMAPIMEGPSQSQVVDQGDDQLLVTLTYYYRDWLRDGDDCSRARPLRCGIARECRGFATRTFTVSLDEAGPRVVGMTGRQSGLTPPTAETPRSGSAAAAPLPRSVELLPRRRPFGRVATPP